MDIKTLTFGAQLTSYKRRKDRSMSLTFVTQELDSQEVMEIDKELDMFGYLLFKPESPLTASEIDELDNMDIDLDLEPKRASERLRNVLWVSWKQDNKGHREFKMYYHYRMENLIELLKSKLDD